MSFDDIPCSAYQVVITVKFHQLVQVALKYFDNYFHAGTVKLINLLILYAGKRI